MLKLKMYHSVHSSVSLETGKYLKDFLSQNSTYEMALLEIRNCTVVMGLMLFRAIGSLLMNCISHRRLCSLPGQEVYIQTSYKPAYCFHRV